MNDSYHTADELVCRALGPKLGLRVPPDLGSETLRMLEARMRSEGFPEPEHAREILSRALLAARETDCRGNRPGIQDVSAWFVTLASNEMRRYVAELAEHDSCFLLSLLEGEEVFQEPPALREERMLARVHKAIALLPEPYRRFLHLDIVELLPGEIIQQRLSIGSRAALLRLKRKSFEALRAAVRTVNEMD